MESGMSKSFWLAMLACFCTVDGIAQTAASAVVYRCPGNPVLYTDAISAKEAKDKGCKVLDGAPITVIQGPKPRIAASAVVGPTGLSGSTGSTGTRVDPIDQRARDSDSRLILDAELKREEDRLAVMKIEFSNGQPERRGDEKNYQKYLDRVADMKSAIARKESDIAAIKRELTKLSAR